jgi:hypothetical protein
MKRQLFLGGLGRLVTQEPGYLTPERGSIWVGLLLDISGQGVGCLLGENWRDSR